MITLNYSLIGFLLAGRREVERTLASTMVKKAKHIHTYTARGTITTNTITTQITTNITMNTTKCMPYRIRQTARPRSKKWRTRSRCAPSWWWRCFAECLGKTSFQPPLRYRTSRYSLVTSYCCNTSSRRAEGWHWKCRSPGWTQRHLMWELEGTWKNNGVMDIMVLKESWPWQCNC
jgi:hypothetical protein